MPAAAVRPCPPTSPIATSTWPVGISAVMYQSPPTRLSRDAGRYRMAIRSPGASNGSSCSGRIARCSSSVTRRSWTS